MENENVYIVEKEPGRQEKLDSWNTGIGLQAVDGLKPSDYLLDIASQNMDGEITIQEAKHLIGEYYRAKDVRLSLNKEEEADKASANIAALLQEKAFSFTPVGLISIHKRIFNGIFSHAGQLRQHNITKNEYVLNGDSVEYTPYPELMATLEYEINKEKGFAYSGLSDNDKIRHIAAFTADLWQIHPFYEGNTRTTAVFIIKMLRQLKFRINPKPFEKNSLDFRNALVSANCKTPRTSTDTRELIRFFNSLFSINRDFELINVGGCFRLFPKYPASFIEAIS